MLIIRYFILIVVSSFYDMFWSIIFHTFTQFLLFSKRKLYSYLLTFVFSYNNILFRYLFLLYVFYQLNILFLFCVILFSFSHISVLLLATYMFY
jgi:hypothetical protein